MAKGQGFMVREWLMGRGLLSGIGLKAFLIGPELGIANWLTGGACCWELPCRHENSSPENKLTAYRQYPYPARGGIKECRIIDNIYTAGAGVNTFLLYNNITVVDKSILYRAAFFTI